MELCFNPHNVADMLWAMTETGLGKLAVLEVLCESSAKEVLCSNPHVVADTRCAMTQAGSATVSSSLCVRQWPRMCRAPTRTMFSALSGP